MNQGSFGGVSVKEAGRRELWMAQQCKEEAAGKKWRDWGVLGKEKFDSLVSKNIPVLGGKAVVGRNSPLVMCEVFRKFPMYREGIKGV